MLGLMIFEVFNLGFFLLGLCSCDRFEFLLLGLIWEEHEEQVEEHKKHEEIFF